MNRGTIDEAIAKRSKYRNVDEFLEAEQQNPMKGTKLVREYVPKVHLHIEEYSYEDIRYP